MHKSLLGCVYSNTLFLPLTIRARVCIILWDMPVLNYSVTHLCHNAAFNKHICTFSYKKTDWPTQIQQQHLSQFLWRGGNPIALLSEPVWRLSLCQASFVRGEYDVPPVHLETTSSVYFNGPWAFSVMSKRKHSSISLHKCIKQAPTLHQPHA